MSMGMSQDTQHWREMVALDPGLSPNTAKIKALFDAFPVVTVWNLSKEGILSPFFSDRNPVVPARLALHGRHLGQPLRLQHRIRREPGGGLFTWWTSPSQPFSLQKTSFIKELEVNIWRCSLSLQQQCEVAPGKKKRIPRLILFGWLFDQPMNDHHWGFFEVF